MKTYKTYKLRNGYTIPWISFGTGLIWQYIRNKPLFFKHNLLLILRSIKHLKINRQLKGNLLIKSILNNSYNEGFRFFDTGRAYSLSELYIGKVLSQKQDIFVTTKCSTMDVTREFSPSDVKGNLELSLKYLNREYVDLYLFHWPEGDWLNYYSQIIELYKQGKVKAFGACNLSIENLKEIENAGLELPMVMQTEMHPLYARHELRQYCQDHNIQVMAHTPTCRNCDKFTKIELIQELSKKYHKTPAQIAIRWHYQHNVIPVVSCFNKEHMRDNLNIFDFELEQQEMELIDKLDCNYILLNVKGSYDDDPNFIYNL